MAAKRTRRVSIAALALIASASLGLTACTGSTFIGGGDEANSVSSELAGSIDQAIENAIQLSGADSAVVGVWTGSGDYVHGYGEGVQADSPIRAAQASQPVMCALLLELVEDGTLSLDQEVSEELTRQHGIEGITYGMLCDATSGLADFKPRLVDIFANNPTRGWSDRELLAHALAHSPVSAPGAEQHISDTDTLLLARALRQAAGTRVNALLREHVFEPSEMHSSFFPGDPLNEMTLPGGGMNGYTYPMAAGAPVCTVSTPVEVPAESEGEEPRVEFEITPRAPHLVDQVSPSMLNGAGATVTTVTDLKRFYERYLAGGFGPEGSAALITSLPTLSAAEPAEPAEGEEAPAEGENAEPSTDGWTFGLQKHGRLYGMSGSMTGTLTSAYHDPTSGFTVVVAVNNSSAGVGFVRALAFQLAALGGADVDWSAEDQAALLAGLAVCQPAPAEEPAGE